MKHSTREGRSLSKNGKDSSRPSTSPDQPYKPQGRRLERLRDLRAWERRKHAIRRRDCYKARHLISGIADGRLRVTILPGLLGFLEAHPPPNSRGEPGKGKPKQRHAFIASLVQLACLTRRAPAVIGKLEEFAQLAGVCRRTAWSDLVYLCDVGLLEKLPDFQPGRSYGRSGEAIDHRQLANWYRPGPALRGFWQQFERTQAAARETWERRFPTKSPPPRRSTECNFCDPSLTLQKAKSEGSSFSLPKPIVPELRPLPKKQPDGHKGKTSPRTPPTEHAAVLAAAESFGVDSELLRGLYDLFPDVGLQFAKRFAGAG